MEKSIQFTVVGFSVEQFIVIDIVDKLEIHYPIVVRLKAVTDIR
jgi:hypothetical protein